MAREYSSPVEAKAREVVRRHAQQLLDKYPPHSAVRKAYDVAPEGRRDALDDALIFRHLRVAGPELAKYPTPEIGAELILGTKLSVLAPGLTRKEAGAFVAQNVAKTPIVYLWRECRFTEPRLTADNVRAPGTMAVARWVHTMLQRPETREALFKSRAHRFGEGVIEGSVIERLDELEPGDLCPSVSDTMVRAMEREAAELWEGPDELIPPMQLGLEGVEVISSFKRLHIEGITMRHCVAQYAEKVNKQESLILSIQTQGQRSTMELTLPRGRYSGDVFGVAIGQHVGRGNSVAPPECKALEGAIVDAYTRVSRA